MPVMVMMTVLVLGMTMVLNLTDQLILSIGNFHLST